MPRTGRPPTEAKVLTTCQRCGKERWQFPSRIRPYCNRTCFKGSHRVEPLIVPCEHCGRPFEADRWQRTHGKARFCSLHCNNAFDRERHTLDCLNCGKPIHVIPSRQARGGGLYCGRPCQRTFEVLQQSASFWRHVEMSGGPDACWPWMSSTFESGYGRFHVDKKTIRAHREAFERTWGPLPEEHGALHTCDHAICCNPYHLFPGTDLVNIEDRQQKDRQAKGSRMAAAKLVEDDIPIIRSLSRTMHDDEIATMFEVSPACIWMVRTYRSWKHVE